MIFYKTVNTYIIFGMLKQDYPVTRYPQLQ